MRLVLAILAIGSAAQAENGSLALQLPNPPMNYQSDRFRAGNLDCSNAVGGGTNLEFGVTGVINNVGGIYDPMNSYFNEQSKDIGVYARIVIPLDKPRARINCDDLYRLELKNRQLEILKLERELEQLKQLQQDMDFEN
jgi:hypothetical protein